MEVRTRVLRKRKREEAERKRLEESGEDPSTNGLEDKLGNLTTEEDQVLDEDEEEEDGSLGEILELDVQAKASGWSGATKKEKEEDRVSKSNARSFVT